MKKVWTALSDETRRKILSLLKQKEMTVGEIVDCFKITQPTISHHLAVLKDAELLISRKVAQSVVYSLNLTVFQCFMNSLGELFAWESKNYA
ncbi:MAG: winged helix-turn-helix transcriptional regulator [Clostridia bacterium]|nr:winged helix-turn-helix transcriptional regulator [Clostridia bacterium]